MGTTKDYWNKPQILIPLTLIGAIILIVLCYFVWQSPQVYSQGLAVIISAALGAILTAVITRMVIKSQLENEQEKEKNVRIYQMKLDIYSNFVSEMWKMYEDDELDEKELMQLRNTMFSKLIFLLDESEIKDLERNVQILRDDILNENQQYIITQRLSKITQILRNALTNKKDDKKVNVESTMEDNVTNLWDAFSQAAKKSEEEPEIEENEIKIIKNDQVKNTTRQYWHMNMLNRGTQHKALLDGIFELSLIEYGDNKRTEILKQAKKGDIIFLYNKGNRFLGVFEVNGRRIFTRNENGIIEELITDLSDINGSKTTTIIGDNSEDKKYDIYGGLDDGASSCANLIVNPLACKLINIADIIPPYRPTLCRYHKDYANIVLSLYKDAINDADFGKIDGVDIDCDIKTFLSLFN